MCGACRLTHEDDWPDFHRGSFVRHCSHSGIQCGSGSNVANSRFPFGGKIGYIRQPGPVVDLFDLYLPSLPRLHVVSDLSNSVGEPHLQYSILSLDGGNGAFTVCGQKDAVYVVWKAFDYCHD